MDAANFLGCMHRGRGDDGIGASAGWSQQMPEKPHNLELGAHSAPLEFLPVRELARDCWDESGRMGSVGCIRSKIFSRISSEISY